MEHQTTHNGQYIAHPDGPKPGPELSMGTMVVRDALTQFIRWPGARVDMVGIAEILFDVAAHSGLTIDDFNNHSFPATVVGEAFEIFRPAEGVTYNVSLAIAELARKRTAQVCMCSS